MNIRNIALVRATNIIPFDGVVKPLSEVFYLKKNENSIFSQKMKELLRKNNKMPQINYSKLTDDYMKELSQKINEIAREYIPYTSDYNSMILWALNGIVPDDNENGFANNTFSDKSCAIIEGLEEQIETSEVVSLVPTDTAIKGCVKLSSQAIILISKDRYLTLTQNEKQRLAGLDLSVKIYEGDLGEVIRQELEITQRYSAEKLVLTREKKGYKDSPTSEELIRTIDNIAKERNIAQTLFLNIIQQSNDEMDKLQNVKDEYENSLIVERFYQREFFKYLGRKIEIEESLMITFIEDVESIQSLEQLCQKIEEFGIDKYKNIVSEYNKKLEILREQGELPTPQEIVDSVRKKQVIDLNGLIENVEIEDSEISINDSKKTVELNIENDIQR